MYSTIPPKQGHRTPRLCSNCHTKNTWYINPTSVDLGSSKLDPDCFLCHLFCYQECSHSVVILAIKLIKLLHKIIKLLLNVIIIIIIIGVQVGRMGCVPAHGGNGNSRNVSRSKPSLHCHKRPWEGALYKWLTKSASDAMHKALHK